MNEVTLAITIRGIVMVLILVVAAIQLVLGYKSYRAKSEIGLDKSTLTFGDLKISSNSVGAFIMASASVWTVAVIQITPDYSKTPNAERVTALPSAVEFQTSVLVASPTSDPEKVMSNPDELRALFSLSASKAQASPSGWLTLNSVPARFDLNSVRAVKSDHDTYLIKSNVSAGEQSATITYSASSQDGAIQFIPAQVSGQGNHK